MFCAPAEAGIDGSHVVQALLATLVVPALDNPDDLQLLG
jgi:hypothetical protein